MSWASLVKLFLLEMRQFKPTIHAFNVSYSFVINLTRYDDYFYALPLSATTRLKLKLASSIY